MWICTHKGVTKKGQSAQRAGPGRRASGLCIRLCLFICTLHVAAELRRITDTLRDSQDPVASLLFKVCLSSLLPLSFCPQPFPDPHTLESTPSGRAALKDPSSLVALSYSPTWLLKRTLLSQPVSVLYDEKSLSVAPYPLSDEHILILLKPVPSITSRESLASILPRHSTICIFF